MTHIVHGVKTKAQLKAAAKNENALFDGVYFEDPTLFNPQGYSFKSMPVGRKIQVTNHPKRSWYAEVTRVSETMWRVT